jgi:hypothetical protein
MLCPKPTRKTIKILMAHLAQAQINELVNGFLALPFPYDSSTRAVLLQGVSAAYVGLLPAGLPPVIQLRSDLGQMNKVERLADGTVPLRTWLTNAADLAGSTEEARLFLRTSDEIGHQVSGAPRIVASQLPETKEKIVHRNDMVSFGFMTGGVTAASAVAKLMVPRFNNGQRQGPPDVIYLGTGWLITDSLMVTNHHVVNARNENEPPASDSDLQLQSKATRAQFDYDASGVKGVELPILGLEAWEAGLDYAVLRIDQLARAPVRLAPQPLEVHGQLYPPVNIIQHPRGNSKKFAIRNNLVSRATATELRYFTDTEEGASGSPVFDDAWRVVGLHRGSTFADNVDFQGRATAWINLGTPIHAILDDVRNRYPSLTHELSDG